MLLRAATATAISCASARSQSPRCVLACRGVRVSLVADGRNRSRTSAAKARRRLPGVGASAARSPSICERVGHRARRYTHNVRTVLNAYTHYGSVAQVSASAAVSAACVPHACSRPQPSSVRTRHLFLLSPRFAEVPGPVILMGFLRFAPVSTLRPRCLGAGSPWATGILLVVFGRRATVDNVVLRRVGVSSRTRLFADFRCWLATVCRRNYHGRIGVIALMKLPMFVDDHLQK